MQNNLLHLFNEYPYFAVVLSICVSVLVAIAGVVPSFFITAANILFFGFWHGTFISFAGEAIGAGVAYLLYRKGFKKITEQGINKFPRVYNLVNACNKQAAWLIFSLRLIPFIPSGLITFAAAVGKVSFTVFILASSLGKLPALLIEAWSVYELTRFGWQGKLILIMMAGALVYFVVQKRNNDLNKD